MKNTFTVILAVVTFPFFAKAQSDSLRNKINNIIQTRNADIGVSVLSIEDNDTISVHGARNYPMQSVFKFHLGLAILHNVDNGKLTLTQKIFIKKSELLTNTWSPIREDFPNGDINMPLSQLLDYTVSRGDNNGCDILFRLLGGTSVVNKYIHSLGINDVSIIANEAEMHRAWDIQFKNWSTPKAATQLLCLFYQQKILNQQTTNFLYETMLNSPSGPTRIKGLLPLNAKVAHKTGTSDTNDKGITAATNDIGIITLPDGKHIALAVFVCNSSEDSAVNQRIIAEISLAVYEYFNTRP